MRWGGGHPAHQRSSSSKHSTHMVIHTYTDKQTQMNGPGQGPECWEWWGNVGEGLQEVAVTEEVGRRSRVRAFRFPTARAKGSRCLRLPLEVWIELDTMPEQTAPIEKGKESLRFFNICSMDASKTNVFFRPFDLKSSKKQWFWGQAGPGLARLA